MKKVKVSILDENTLSLLENASIGDVISLSDLHEQDISKEAINDSIKNMVKKELESEIEKVRNQLSNEKEKELEIALLKREQEIKEKLDNINSENVKKTNDEITELRLKLEKVLNDNDVLKAQVKKDVEIAVLNTESRYKDNLKDKEFEIKKLEEEKELVVENTKNKLLLEFNEKENNHKYELQLKEREILELKDLNLRRSTKMVGESLERHCEIEFNKIRELFPANIYFEKDNDATTGSKGDYIFKEFDDNGNVVLSIMFEMKNEMDTTASKHRNQDFFKELDKDRNEKHCEYAVLVSLLEKENDLFNDGIYIVPETLYKDMYVIRPQYFIQIIMLLRKLCKKTIELKNEIEKIKERNLDLTKFENNLDDFKDKFGRNYKLASEKFKDAIDRIDKTIDNLQKIKSDLVGSDNNLRIANNKLDDLSLKKLAKDSPSILENTKKQEKNEFEPLDILS